MTILVTGALGFVGANLVRHLAEAGEAVVALDAAERGPAEAAFLAAVRERITIVRVDVRDREAMAAALRRAAPRIVIHGAAITPDPALERAEPARVVDVNVGGTVNLLEAARATPGIRRLVLLSSSAVYGAGEPGMTTLAETAPLAGRNLYAATKIAAERIAARYAELGGPPCVIARLPPVYGPLEHAKPTRPAISAVGRLVAGAATGERLRVAGPAIVRDWTWAGDVAAAIAALAGADNLRHAVYNVGSGVGVTFADIVAAAVTAGLRATWSDRAEDADVAMRPEDARTPLDISRLIADTAFTPLVPIGEGVARAVAALAGRREGVPA